MRTKSAAIPLVVHEMARRGALGRAEQFGELPDAGLRAPLNANRKVQAEDEIWL